LDGDRRDLLEELPRPREPVERNLGSDLDHLRRWRAGDRRALRDLVPWAQSDEEAEAEALALSRDVATAELDAFLRAKEEVRRAREAARPQGALRECAGARPRITVPVARRRESRSRPARRVTGRTGSRDDGLPRRPSDIGSSGGAR
jgi:hypothetical protein